MVFVSSSIHSLNSFDGSLAYPLVAVRMHICRKRRLYGVDKTRFVLRNAYCSWYQIASVSDLTE